MRRALSLPSFLTALLTYLLHRRLLTTYSIPYVLTYSLIPVPNYFKAEIVRRCAEWHDPVPALLGYKVYIIRSSGTILHLRCSAARLSTLECISVYAMRYTLYFVLKRTPFDCMSLYFTLCTEYSILCAQVHAFMYMSFYHISYAVMFYT